MLGVSIVRLLDQLSVSRIREARGVSPRSIIVEGVDFSSVESVIINGSVAPEFTVMSSTQLIAQVPDDQDAAILTDVVVLSARLTLTERSLVTFTVGTRVRTVSGPQRLMQVFLRHLFRNPGSNVFHPRSGGGLTKRIGTVYDMSAAADVTTAIAAARQYIVNAQTGDRTIPPSERLLSAEILGIRADPSTTTLYVAIVLTNHAGDRAAAALVA